MAASAVARRRAGAGAHRLRRPIPIRERAWEGRATRMDEGGRQRWRVRGSYVNGATLFSSPASGIAARARPVRQQSRGTTPGRAWSTVCGTSVATRHSKTPASGVGTSCWGDLEAGSAAQRLGRGPPAAGLVQQTDSPPSGHPDSKSSHTPRSARSIPANRHVPQALWSLTYPLDPLTWPLTRWLRCSVVRLPALDSDQSNRARIRAGQPLSPLARKRAPGCPMPIPDPRPLPLLRPGMITNDHERP